MTPKEFILGNMLSVDQPISMVDSYNRLELPFLSSPLRLPAVGLLE